CEAAELHDAMRVVAVGAFGMAVREVADAELDARLEEILAAHVGRAGAVDEARIAEGAVDVVHLGARGLVERADRHAPRELEIAADVSSADRCWPRGCSRRSPDR